MGELPLNQQICLMTMQTRFIPQKSYETHKLLEQEKL